MIEIERQITIDDVLRVAGEDRGQIEQLTKLVHGLLQLLSTEQLLQVYENIEGKDYCYECGKGNNWRDQVLVKLVP